jgi:hypothetical protein
MLRRLNLLFVLCSCLAGCQSAPSLAMWSGHAERHENEKHLSMNDLHRIDEGLSLDTVGRQIEPNYATGTSRSSLVMSGSFEMSDRGMKEIASQEREFLREQISGTARGSQVGIYDESGGRYSGTVLYAGPDRMEMINGVSQEAIPGPDGLAQCKTSHIPFLTVETSAVTHFVTIAPPPPDFPATDAEIDGEEYSVAEIVNKSGARQRWGKAPVTAPSNSRVALVR